MLRTVTAELSNRTRALQLQLARSAREIGEAQRLRYLVFAEELGARVRGWEHGVDSDEFDGHCDHLLVRDRVSGEVVGTYRLLPGERASRPGSFYSDRAFDLTRLNHLRRRTVEAGRSCVHPAYRGGAAIAMLWSGLARYACSNGYEYVMGCASIGMADGGCSAAGIFRQLKGYAYSPREYRVFPRRPLPLTQPTRNGEARLPPLIKGYVRAGASVCGAPAWDPEFNTADLLMLLPMSAINPRYEKRFFEPRQ